MFMLHTNTPLYRSFSQHLGLSVFFVQCTKTCNSTWGYLHKVVNVTGVSVMPGSNVKCDQVDHDLQHLSV